MPYESIEQASRQADQFKQELDRLNPKLNQAEAQLVETTNKLRDAEQQIARLLQERAAMTTALTEAKAGISSLREKLAAQAQAAATAQAQSKQAVAQRDVAMARDTRSRRALSAIVKQGTDLLQEQQAFDEVAAAGKEG